MNANVISNSAWEMLRAIALLYLSLSVCQFASADRLFDDEVFTDQDSVLVRDEDGNVLYQWLPERARTPASVVKLLTADLAIEKWGLAHRFKTEFYQHGEQLWVKGYGDPYLVSEEIDLLVAKLASILGKPLASIHIDTSYLQAGQVPGRSGVLDPYNAPLSAVAANFNTVFLRRTSQGLESAEPQTPLTPLAIKLGQRAGIAADGQAVRINLQTVDNAQQYFAELLRAKLGWAAASIRINQQLPDAARLLYRHENSHALATVIRGALEYSNNFIANQLYLLLGEHDQRQVLTFADARVAVAEQLQQRYGWASPQWIEGAGLSRQNQFSATAIMQVLEKLEAHRALLRSYSISSDQVPALVSATANAKSGTLQDVHALAGYLTVNERDVYFVLLFNQRKPYRYREQLLQKLAEQLVDVRAGDQDAR